jgi:hypothetical protein
VTAIGDSNDVPSDISLARHAHYPAASQGQLVVEDDVMGNTLPAGMRVQVYAGNQSHFAARSNQRRRSSVASPPPWATPPQSICRSADLRVTRSDNETVHARHFLADGDYNPSVSRHLLPSPECLSHEGHSG